MISEEEKFKAQTFRIFGLALLTLLGRIFLDPLEFFLKYGLILSISYTTLALSFALLGFILIDKGRDIISEKRRIKWK